MRSFHSMWCQKSHDIKGSRSYRNKCHQWKDVLQLLMLCYFFFTMFQSKVVLIGLNIKSIDCHLLLNALESCSKTDAFYTVLQDLLTLGICSKFLVQTWNHILRKVFFNNIFFQIILLMLHLKMCWLLEHLLKLLTLMWLVPSFYLLHLHFQMQKQTFVLFSDASKLALFWTSSWREGYQ